MTDWTFGYDGWLVWDGEYPDVEVGGVFEAGIEFWFVGRCTPSDTETLEVQSLGDCLYMVTAKVVEIDNFVVLDLGPLVVSCMAAPMSSTADLVVGDVVRAKIGLALDPFGHWGESGARKKRWTVSKILCTRHAKYPSLSRSLGHEVEEIRAINTETVDSLDACVIECIMASDQ